MKDQTEKLKAELSGFIELAKTITPGKWSPGSESIWSRNERICGDVETDDMIFIARSRNISPEMAECLLVAVERISQAQQAFSQISRLPQGLDGNAGADSLAENGYDELHDGLQQILDIWEAAK